MAVDIILRFEDEDEAKTFVREWADAVRGNNITGDWYVDADVVNVQKVPPDYCRCPYRKGKAYIRGNVYGWWVCPQCNRVTKRSFDNWSSLGPGINLLPNQLRQSTRGPECYEASPREWAFLIE